MEIIRKFIIPIMVKKFFFDFENGSIFSKFVLKLLKITTENAVYSLYQNLQFFFTFNFSTNRIDY